MQAAANSRPRSSTAPRPSMPAVRRRARPFAPTAITVAAIAVVAVSAKDIAARLSAGRDGGGTLVMRGIEFGAAGLVLLFGLGLLFGYLAAERVTCL